MKWDRSSLIALVYSLFTALYTLYISHYFRYGKGSAWTYLIEFLLIDGYVFFTLQGLAFRSKNWGVVLLLPLAVWVTTIGLGFGVIALFRVGGFNDKDRHNIDMAIICAIFLGCSLYAQKWIRPRKGKRH